jgi:hypothetical protein
MRIHTRRKVRFIIEKWERKKETNHPRKFKLEKIKKNGCYFTPMQFLDPAENGT